MTLDKQRLYIVETGDEEGHSEVILRTANRGKAQAKAVDFDLPRFHWINVTTFVLTGDGEWVKAEAKDDKFLTYSRAPDLDGDEVEDDNDLDFDDSMDGDHESALASAGFGTDEDYGSF